MEMIIDQYNNQMNNKQNITKNNKIKRQTTFFKTLKVFNDMKVNDIDDKEFFSDD